MKFKPIKYGLITLVAFGMISMTGCATFQSLGVASKPAKTVQLTNPDPVSITIPEGNGIVGGTCTSIVHQTPVVWGVISYDGKIVKRQLLRIKDVSDNSFMVERRTDNGVTGSGIIYKVDYSVRNGLKDRILTISPVQYETYQEGLMAPFPVPEFSEKDLINFILKQVGGSKSA